MKLQVLSDMLLNTLFNYSSDLWITQPCLSHEKKNLPKTNKFEKLAQEW